MAGSSYDNIINYGGDTHMGDVHHQGLSREQKALRSIIESLRYDGMDSRREMLAEAERGTFEWALKDAGSEVRGRRWDWAKVNLTFRPWLEGDDERMFCFLGKPGSGKSTFMKFLSNYPGVEEACQVWLKGKRLLRAEHFFWITDSGIQNSYVGLLRSFLHQCLLALSKSDSQSDVQLVTSALRPRLTSLRSHAAWDSRELEDVLSRLLLSLPDAKCFFLIDGLDECEPQQQLHELARKVYWISQLSNVKLCVSCRPWESLTQVTTLELTLCIDKLTHNDMEAYFGSRLLRAGTKDISHWKFQEQFRRLMYDIVKAAEGVFLWLELMMNELISAVRKNSDIDGLRRVFTNFPPDLNAYFTALIYERIPRGKSNISDTASALKLAMVIHTDARRPNSYGYPRSVVNFWLLQNGDLIEGMPWYDMDVRPYSTVECEHMVETTKRFLSETCRDFLVVVPEGASQTPLYADVEFLHRSVFDFLNSPDMKFEIENASPKHFEKQEFPNELCKMRWLCFLRIADLGCEDMRSLSFDAINELFAYRNQRPNRRFVSMCDRLLAKHVVDTCNCIGSKHQLSDFGRMVLLRNGCTEYFLALFKKWPQIARSDKGFEYRSGTFVLELLDFYRSDPACTSIKDLFNVMLMCGLQLNGLCELMWPHSNNSLWSEWLVKSKREARDTHFTPDAWATWQTQKVEVASMMIEHGADPFCLPCIDEVLNFAPVRINEIFESILSPGHIEHIRSLLAEHSRHPDRRIAQRKQRVRAIRAFLISEKNYNAAETHAGADSSWWVYEKRDFLRWFLHECMAGGERKQTCLTDNSSNGLPRALSTWCFDCNRKVTLCQMCFRKIDGTYDLLIANAFETNEIANPQCVHAILQSSLHTWGAPGQEDYANRVLDILKEWYHKILQSSLHTWGASGQEYCANRVLDILKEWYHKNPLPEEEMRWLSDTDGEEMHSLISGSAADLEESD